MNTQRMSSKALPGAKPFGTATLKSRPLVVRCLASKKIAVLGGTGRVGSSTVSSLLQNPDYEVIVASRSKESYDRITQFRPELKKTQFHACDITDPKSIKDLLQQVDLVVHTAGPFQRSNNWNVLEAAIETKTPYIDVCDDSEYSEKSRTYCEAAKAAGVPAIITAGIYPGTSNVMAAHMLSIARQEYDDDFNYRQRQPGEGVEPKLLRYSYFTAGSGGAGPTILETSFLLAGEPCTVYKDDKAYTLPPISNPRTVDFGPGIGRKGTYLYNLPEVHSARKHLNVPGVSARFGTDPFFWNWAMWLLARLAPKALLEDRAKVAWLASKADPMVRFVDKLCGEKVAMRVEIDFEGNKNIAGLFVHKKLSESMGHSVAGFARAVLNGETSPGVWYPEEPEALADRRAFLEYASQGCFRFIMNKSLWALESEVKQIGGLIYW